jgi:predicted ATPase/class 3 adenylate cyclase
MLAGVGAVDSRIPDPSYATHTFLFTDVEGSTRRWNENPGDMAVVLADHDHTVSAVIEAHRGVVFKRTGDGIHAVFPSVVEAVRAAVEAQRQLELPVRMGVHCGEATERDGDFFGIAVNRCARLMNAGHGRQVLVSATAASVAAEVLGPEIALRDLGEHRLRDLSRPERIFQVVAPDLPSRFPRLRSLDGVRHNLPVLRSSFVGRQVELDELRERLLGGQFVTLTGIGGCGKTRLALESAARLVEQFPDGVFCAQLSSISEPELLGQTVASALGLQLVDTGVDSLARYLQGRRVLLVVDNCEHLLDACAELIAGLSARCPDLHLLATSREALGLDAEHAFPVPSLDPGTDGVRLFVDRARASGAELRLGAADRQVIVEVTRRLDGIPLAIELAAARTTHLAPTQILERLSDRFRLLTGGRHRVQRQQTLAAVIDWSYELLSEEEQRLFRRLAVFRGSFSLPAVEEVCGGDALDDLGSLAAKSLVSVAEGDDMARYRLLETVRLYAEERLLASGEAAALRSAHRDWSLQWLESFPVDELLGTGGGSQLVPEADNLIGALDWSREQGRADLIARMASRMIGYWWSYVRIAEMATWWRELERSLPHLVPDLRAAALLVGVEHAMVTGDFEEMERLSDAALAIADFDSWVAAYAWSRQALYWTYADPERGKRCIEQGRASARAAGVPEIERTTALWGANLLTGDPRRDEELGAQQLFHDLLAMIKHESSVNALVFLGILAVLGDTETAAHRAAQLPGRSPLERYSREFLAATIAIYQRRSELASKHLAAVAAIVREYAIPLGDVSCLIGYATLAANDGEFETASRHLATARSAGAFPFRTPLEILLYRTAVAVVRDMLEPDIAQRCRAEGAEISVDEALDAELARRGVS